LATQLPNPHHGSLTSGRKPILHYHRNNFKALSKQNMTKIKKFQQNAHRNAHQKLWSPEVMVTNLTKEEHISLHQRQEQLAPVKKFIANHPLRGLLASGTSSSASRGPDNRS
jgi:hypothetical protein